MKRSEIPHLEDLRAFDATARCGSVRAAADELSLTHAAVSRRITRLAQDIGQPLFKRVGRNIALTAQGEELHASCKRAFSELERSVRSLRTPPSLEDTALLLSCERSVAMRWLIPRLSQFQDAHPDIVVHLSVGGGSIDFDPSRPMIALRRLDFPVKEDWIITPLFEESVGPVMAEKNLEGFKQGTYVGLASKTRPTAWDDWLHRNPTASPPSSIQTFDHHFLMVEAACAGLGVAPCPYILAKDDLATGRLHAPLGFDADGTRYGLLHAQDHVQVTGQALLVDWIIERCDGL